MIIAFFEKIFVIILRLTCVYVLFMFMLFMLFILFMLFMLFMLFNVVYVVLFNNPSDTKFFN